MFFVALVFTIFAVVQDFKRREVANWINFSFVAIALAYRAFYSLNSGNWDFFVFGLLGFAIFFALANAFYYSKSFGGGDAKLLMGFGVILPYANYSDLFFVSILFLILLFGAGAVYSLGYSLFLVYRNIGKFKKEFVANLGKFRLVYLVDIVLIILSFIMFEVYYAFSIAILLILFALLYIYLRSLDNCMIVLRKPTDLTEGDWLVKDFFVKGKWIRKSVHGLSFAQIKVLRKAKKSVLIKEGIEFTPAFLIALLVFVVLTGYGLAGFLNSYF